MLLRTARENVMSEGIQGKVVLILGGAGGIGSATARDLASRGAKIAVADIDGAKCDAVVETIRNSDGDIRGYHADIVNEAGVKAVVMPSYAISARWTC
jgi:NAD(P)-dependent dehydrogenase (short-subunit alcohol dehydrogenase family)